MIIHRYFAQLAASVIRKETNPQNTSYLLRFLPTLLWLFRDVTLELPVDKNGAIMTATEYLREHVLKKSRGSDSMHELLSLFPNMEASMLPQPHENPQKMPKSDLNKPFQQEVESQIEKILISIKPKEGLTHNEMDGPLLCSLITEYAQAINSPETIPDIEHSWYAAAYVHIVKTKDKLLQKYTDDLQRLVENKLPMEVGKLEDDSQTTLCGCHNLMLEKCIMALNEAVEKFMLPAGSKKDFREKIEALCKEFRNEVGCFDESMKVHSGKLYCIAQKNFDESDRTCQHIFLTVYEDILRHGKLNIEELMEIYYQKTKKMGPAQEKVLNDELDYISGPPSDVIVSIKDSNHLILMWKKPKFHPHAAKDFDIQIKEVNNEEWKSLQTTWSHSGDEYTAKVSALSPNTIYSFRIRGKNANRVGEFCTNLRAQTLAGKPDCPQKPDFKQEKPDEAIITMHPLQKGQDNGSKVSVVALKWYFVNDRSNEYEANEQTHEIVDGFEACIQQRVKMESFKEEGCYMYSLRYKNEIGYSHPSPPREVYTKDLFPGKPSKVEIECHVRSVTFMWQPPEYHPKSVKQYEIKWRECSTSNWRCNNLPVCSFTADMLQPYTKYEYELSSRNFLSKGGSVDGTVHTHAACPEQPESPLLEVLSSHKVRVTVYCLKKEQENGKPVTHVKIEKSPDKSHWVPCDIAIEKQAIEKHRTISKELELCSTDNSTVTVYVYFRILMRNEEGWSEPSEQVEVHTTELIPSAPLNVRTLSEHSGPRQICLEWDNPMYHPDTVKGYSIKVQRTNQVESNCLSCAKPPMTLLHLCPNTNYLIEVKSLNKKDLSECCELNYTTPYACPCAPSRGQVRIDVQSDKTAKCTVTIPPAQPDEKDILYVIVEISEHGKEWETGAKETVTGPAGGDVEVQTCYKRYMRVRFESEVGTGEPSLIITLPESEYIPGEPTNFVVSHKGLQAIFNWDKPQVNQGSVKKYHIEKEKGNGWYKISSISADNELRHTTELEPCKTVRFRICAKNERKKKGNYSEVVVTAPPRTPEIPAIKMIQYNEIQVTIPKTDLEKVEKIQIESQEEKGHTWKSEKMVDCAQLVNNPAHPHKVKIGVAFKGTPSCWRLKTKNGSLESDYCEPVEFNKTDYIPKMPTGVRVTEITEVALKIQWDKPTDLSERIEKYVGIATSTKDEVTKEVWVSKDEYKCLITSLGMNTGYKVAVMATNEAHKVKSKELTIHPKCGAPMNVRKAGATRSRIKIRWQPPTDADDIVEKYECYYKLSEEERNREQGGKDATDGEGRDPYTHFKTVSRGLSAVKDELQSGTKYDFMIIPVNKDGEKGGRAECMGVSTKHSIHRRILTGTAIAIPTLGIGSVILKYEWESDTDVYDSSG